ncbi:hypothetical protein TUBRATIS_25130 [Tubulinosema ratisbonensis]|uniref:Uncharacterized protein n=1 Tax=Tubulinosema ratisbonensis TaxID=291195 RepID=A0A437AIX9_9MICR|nr:hypothetical protein TUBRATIS_25130 [Tubulinosema ratisbonensis]
MNLTKILLYFLIFKSNITPNKLILKTNLMFKKAKNTDSLLFIHQSPLILSNYFSILKTIFNHKSTKEEFELFNNLHINASIIYEKIENDSTFKEDNKMFYFYLKKLTLALTGFLSQFEGNECVPVCFYDILNDINGLLVSNEDEYLDKNKMLLFRIYFLGKLLGDFDMSQIENNPRLDDFFKNSNN